MMGASIPAEGRWDRALLVAAAREMGTREECGREMGTRDRKSVV